MQSRVKVKIYNTPYFAEIWEKDLKDVESKHPKLDVAVCFDVKCDLDKLKSNESVCFGDGKHYFFVLTDNRI